METLGHQKREYISALPRALRALVRTDIYSHFWTPNKCIALIWQKVYIHATWRVLLQIGGLVTNISLTSYTRTKWVLEVDSRICCRPYINTQVIFKLHSTVPDRYPVDLSGSRRFDQLNFFPGVQGNEKNWSPRFQMYNHVWRPRPFYAPDRISIKLCISASESLRDSILGSKLPQ